MNAELRYLVEVDDAMPTCHAMNAELRYLVEVDEAWQERVLSMAYEGVFDKVAPQP